MKMQLQCCSWWCRILILVTVAIKFNASRTNIKLIQPFKYKAKHNLTNDKWFNGCMSMNVWGVLYYHSNIIIFLKKKLGLSFEQSKDKLISIFS